MENEIRFYYSNDKYEELKKILNREKDLNYEGCFHEITVQYDHPIISKSFYEKEVDGRFRIRTSEEINTKECKAKISWKRRNRNTFKNLVNAEEEVEINFKYEELNNLIYLLESVIQMRRIESYERYRNIFSNNEIEIVVDKYPFGVALEIENKSSERNPEETVLSWVKQLNLELDKAYRLSWDDKYTQLCKEQNIERFVDVKFGLPMPKIID